MSRERKQCSHIEREKEQGLEIGAHTYGRPIIKRYQGDYGRVIIGKFCSIAEEVRIFVGGNHRVDWISTYPFRIKFDLPGKYQDGQPASRGDVIIGHNVWIGYGATILSGVRVGSGVVIGARSVVTRSVPPYTIVAGNPARIIRQRFPDQIVEALLKIAWWEWPEEKIKANIDLLCSDRVEEFCRKFGGLNV